MVEHLADCDDCRESVVIAAEAPRLHLVPASGNEPPPSVEPPPAVEPRPPRGPGFRRRYGPWAAAVAGLAATVVVAIQLQRPATPSGTGQPPDPWEAIAGAVGPTRLVEPRLARVRGHVALTPPTRSAGGGTPAFAAAAVAARLADEAAAAPAARQAAAYHAAGVAALVAGQPGPALKLLDAAMAAAPGSPELWSDLAAAHLVIASQGSALHWTAALDATDTALRADPGLPAARFNRALALEGLGRADEAREAWRLLVAAADDDAGWRAEAADHLQRLSR